jgi:hypothetical protein
MVISATEKQCDDFALAWLRVAPNGAANSSSLQNHDCERKMFGLRAPYSTLVEFYDSVQTHMNEVLNGLIEQILLAAKIVRAPPADDGRGEVSHYGTIAVRNYVEQMRLACSASLYRRARGEEPCAQSAAQSCLDLLAHADDAQKPRVISDGAVAHALCLQVACANGLRRLEDVEPGNGSSNCDENARTAAASCALAAAAGAATGVLAPESENLTTRAVNLADRICRSSLVSLARLGNQDLGTPNLRQKAAEEVLRAAQTPASRSVATQKPNPQTLSQQLQRAAQQKKSMVAALSDAAVSSALRLRKSKTAGNEKATLLVRGIVESSYGGNAGGLFRERGNTSPRSSVLNLARKAKELFQYSTGAKSLAQGGAEYAQGWISENIDLVLETTLIDIAEEALIATNLQSDDVYKKHSSELRKLLSQYSHVPAEVPVTLLLERLGEAWYDNAVRRRTRVNKAVRMNDAVESLGPLLSSGKTDFSSLAGAGFRVLTGAPLSPKRQRDLKQLMRGETSLSNALAGKVSGMISGRESAERLTEIYTNVLDDPRGLIEAEGGLTKLARTAIEREVSSEHPAATFDENKNAQEYAIGLLEVVFKGVLEKRIERKYELDKRIFDKYHEKFKDFEDLHSFVQNAWSRLASEASSISNIRDRLRRVLSDLFQRLIYIARVAFRVHLSEFHPNGSNLTSYVTDVSPLVEEVINDLTEAPLQYILNSFTDWFGKPASSGQEMLVKGALTAAAGTAGALAAYKLYKLAMHTRDKHLPPQIAHDLERAAHGRSLDEGVANVIGTVAAEVPMKGEERNSLRAFAERLAHGLTGQTEAFPAAEHPPLQPHSYPSAYLSAVHPPFHPRAIPYESYYPYGHPAYTHAYGNGPPYAPPALHGASPVLHYPPLYLAHQAERAVRPVQDATGSGHDASLKGSLKSLVSGIGDFGGLAGIGSLFSGMLGNEQGGEEPEDYSSPDADGPRGPAGLSSARAGETRRVGNFLTAPPPRTTPQVPPAEGRYKNSPGSRAETHSLDIHETPTPRSRTSFLTVPPARKSFFTVPSATRY